MRTAPAMVLVLALVSACRRSDSAESSSRSGDAASAAERPTDAVPRLATASDALAAFLTGWNLSVLPHARESERGLLQAIDRAMQEAPEKLDARREPCRESKAIVERICREANFDFVVYGALEDLEVDGDCWRVMYEGGVKAEAIGYLDPVSGRLLLVWRVPEG